MYKAWSQHKCNEIYKRNEEVRNEVMRAVRKAKNKLMTYGERNWWKTSVKKILEGGN